LDLPASAEEIKDIDDLTPYERDLLDALRNRFMPATWREEAGKQWVESRKRLVNGEA